MKDVSTSTLDKSSIMRWVLFAVLFELFSLFPLQSKHLRRARVDITLALCQVTASSETFWMRPNARARRHVRRKKKYHSKKNSLDISFSPSFFFSRVRCLIFLFHFFSFSFYLRIVSLLDSSMEVLTSSSTYFSISEPKAKLMTRYSREMTLINSDSSDLTKKKVRSSWFFLFYFIYLFLYFICWTKYTFCKKRRIEFMTEMEISADEEKKKSISQFPASFVSTLINVIKKSSPVVGRRAHSNTFIFHFIRHRELEFVYPAARRNSRDSGIKSDFFSISHLGARSSLGRTFPSAVYIIFHSEKSDREHFQTFFLSRAPSPPVLSF